MRHVLVPLDCTTNPRDVSQALALKGCVCLTFRVSHPQRPCAEKFDRNIDRGVCCAGMRRDPGSVLSAEREREMGRSKHKAVWSAVLAAGSGV